MKNANNNTTYEFKIDKNVPLPAPRGKWSHMKTMKVGESFLIPPSMVVKSTRAVLYMAAKLNKMKISVRQSEEGLRVWCVEKYS